VSLKRSMGKRTTSQGKKGSKGDGLVFTLATMPPRMFRPVQLSSATYKIAQETTVVSYFASSASIPTFMSTYFTIAILDQVSTLAALFDQYRINEVEVWLVPQSEFMPTSAAGASGNQLATVIDYDDAAALTTFGQAMDYVNCVLSPGSCAHYRRFKPHAAVAAYSGTFASYANVTSPWIDAVSTGVQHYGLKVASTTGIVVRTYDLYIRLQTEWRNLR